MGTEAEVSPEFKLSRTLVLCEHASDSLKEMQNNGEGAPHDYHDPGASFFGFELIEHFKCVGLFSEFSKLLIDPSLPPFSDQTIRLSYKSNGKEIDTNECKCPK